MRAVLQSALADLADVPAASRWVRSGDLRLHVLDYGGAGVPLVVLPGITSPAITMDFVARELTDLVRPIVVDVRGRGLSDSGKTYTSFPSARNYTTAASQNPNANGCQQTYGNGLTGSSGSYTANTQTVDRLAGNYPAAPFVDDEYMTCSWLSPSRPSTHDMTIRLVASPPLGAPFAMSTDGAGDRSDRAPPTPSSTQRPIDASNALHVS